MLLEPNVVEGVHRIEDAYTNWYLIEDDGRLTIVDTGMPTSWSSLLSALRSLGRGTSDVEAVVLTHGHFDHLGFAERARRELVVPVWIHENDVPLTRHPLQYGHARPRSHYLVTQPRALPIVVALTRNRAWWPWPVREVQRYQEGTLPFRVLRAWFPRPATALCICRNAMRSSPATRSSRSTRTRRGAAPDRGRSRNGGRPPRARLTRRARSHRGSDRPCRSRRPVDGWRRGGCARRSRRGSVVKHLLPMPAVSRGFAAPLAFGSSICCDDPLDRPASV